MADEIALVDYDPSWPKRYEQEMARILAALPSDAVSRAEHIGSTAVPGMVAKPIVDILLGVDSLDDARRVIPPLLETLGYAFWREKPKEGPPLLRKGSTAKRTEDVPRPRNRAR